MSASFALPADRAPSAGPNQTLGLDPCLENTFEVGADPFSPEGVRSVGPRLFDNLILQTFWERQSCLRGGCQRGRVLDPAAVRSVLGSYFQIAQNLNSGLPEPAIGFVFSKPPSVRKIGFVAQNSRSRKTGSAKNAFCSPFKHPNPPLDAPKLIESSHVPNLDRHGAPFRRFNVRQNQRFLY
jgi:hypothetical protein